jgi:6-phosphogluconolactonase (cycloisomerase 2 family)
MDRNTRNLSIINLHRVLTIIAAAIFIFGTTTVFAQESQKDQKTQAELITQQIQKNPKVKMDRQSRYFNRFGFGAVFAMTNATSGNAIVRYARLRNGRLIRLRHNISTRGLGIGVDTDTQGPLRFGKNRHYLYAVNAGSDSISVFKVFGVFLRLIQVVDAGDEPLSLTVHGNLLYSMDGSVAGNGIRGFKIANDGTLTQLPNSFRALSSPIAVPGEVRFSPDGRKIFVTEKTTNTVLSPQNAIDVFTIDSNGYASEKPLRDASFGTRPFSLDFRNSDGRVVVTESFNATPNLAAASSYDVNSDGTLSVISGSVPNEQTDTCWVVISKNGKYAYMTNFGSGTISSYRIDPNGSLTLVQGTAASTGATSQPVDLTLSRDGHYLYELLRGTGAVAAYRVLGDGTLQSLGITTGGLPIANGASGLAGF